MERIYPHEARIGERLRWIYDRNVVVEVMEIEPLDIPELPRTLGKYIRYDERQDLIDSEYRFIMDRDGRNWERIEDPFLTFARGVLYGKNIST